MYPLSASRIAGCFFGKSKKWQAFRRRILYTGLIGRSEG